MYPPNTKTLTIELSGNTTQGLIPASFGTTTIFNIRAQQEKDLSTTRVFCNDGTTLIKNYAKDFPEFTMQYVCSNGVSVEKTGNDKVFIGIVFSTDSTSTQPVYSFTGGEIVISIFLLLIFLFITLQTLFGMSIKKIRNVRIIAQK